MTMASKIMSPPPPTQRCPVHYTLGSTDVSGTLTGKTNRGCLFVPSTANIADVIEAPPVAPREYVVGLYNSYAETFDSHLQGSLSYRTPTIVVETLSALFPGKRQVRCLISFTFQGFVLNFE